MACDEDGLMYVAVFGRGDIADLGRDGQVAKRLAAEGMLPTNVFFALPCEHRIQVSEYEPGPMGTFPVNRDALSLWDGRN